jgi:O-acetyl-ADP-ribose deacetylase (regulator of RNase III)
MIIYKKGNLLDAEERYIGHGCNCQGIMGSGVAKALSDKWPIVKKRDRAHFERGMSVLGNLDYVVVEENPSKLVVNLYTQPRPGPCASLHAIRSSIYRFFSDGEGDSAPVSLALPRIGSGLGGLKWEEVEDMIKQAIAMIFEETGVEHKVVIYDLE